jgi:hypothetical protein
VVNLDGPHRQTERWHLALRSGVTRCGGQDLGSLLLGPWCHTLGLVGIVCSPGEARAGLMNHRTITLTFGGLCRALSGMTGSLGAKHGLVILVDFFKLHAWDSCRLQNDV